MKSSKHPLCAVIPGPTLELAKRQIEQAHPLADILEFRVDLFDFKEIAEIRNSVKIPVLFKCPTTISEQDFLRYLDCKPEYIDLDFQMPSSFFFLAKGKLPAAKIICSYHNFEKVPELKEVFKEMAAKPADIYKLAAMVHSSLDTLRMLQFLRGKRNWIVVPMGEHGAFGRILGAIAGNLFTHCAVDQSSIVVPGQFDLKTLIDVYRVPSLTKDTQMYGLIGDPVHLSVSHNTHNAFFKKQDLDAVYVKMRVHPNECETFLKAAQQLGICGLSVTMPLKEIVIPQSGAINTLRLEKEEIFGTNTDGFGAVKAIQAKMSINGKRIVLLGAGGAAKAIALALHKEGAILTILNRTVDKAKNLAERTSGRYFSIDQFPQVAAEGYDLLINCTNTVPIDCKHLLPDRTVMEIISVPKETPLVIEALKKNNQIIYGLEMFHWQAIGQFKTWFKTEYDLKSAGFQN